MRRRRRRRRKSGRGMRGTAMAYQPSFV